MVFKFRLKMQKKIGESRRSIIKLVGVGSSYLLDQESFDSVVFMKNLMATIEHHNKGFNKYILHSKFFRNNVLHQFRQIGPILLNLKELAS